MIWHVAGTRKSKSTFGNVRELPSGRFQARYTIPGTDRTVKAPVTFDGRGDAEAWLSVKQSAFVLGTAYPERAVPIDAPALETFAAEWLAGRELTPRTRHEYVKLLEQHIEPTFAGEPVDKITQQGVRAWYVKLGTLTGPTRRAHAYALMRSIMQGAVVDGLTVANPCQIKGASHAKRAKQIKPATLEELATIVANMPDRLRLMALFASWCALRFGETAELRRKDIDVRRGVIHVRRGVTRVSGGHHVGPPKSTAGIRDVAIPPHLMPAVKSHLKHHVGRGADALLFPAATGGHLSTASLYDYYYPAREVAGREDLRWHDLRHTGAVLAASTGATLAELMARLGHSSPGMALRYQHAAAGRDAEIAAALSKMVVDER